MASLPPSRILLPSDFKEIGFAYTRWAVTLPETGEIEDVENHDFWKHIVKKMKPGDMVEVRNAEHSIFAEVYIRATDPFAVVEILRAHKIGRDVEIAGNFTVTYVPSRKSHCVYLNKQLLREGFQTREAAAAWVEDHKKQVGITTAKAA
jgi:hypothetical protein